MLRGAVKMVATIIAVAIVAVLAVVGVMKIGKTAKGGGSCCTSGDSGEIKPKKKKLDGEIIAEKVVDIEGMSCINCQYKVERKINDIDGVAANVNFRKNEAHVKMDRDVEDSVIKGAVESLGYKVLSIHSA